jgi:hypothetical protein
MSLLKQINDKGAVLSWSPLATSPNLVALGTKVILAHTLVDVVVSDCSASILGFCWYWI